MKLHTQRKLDADGAVGHIGGWMSEYIAGTGLDGWVVGVSGGIDSAVTSTLAARTGRPTTLLRMPIHQAPDQESALAILFQTHPAMKRWPADHGFQAYAMDISDIFVLSFYGGSKPVRVQDYLAYTPPARMAL